MGCLLSQSFTGSLLARIVLYLPFIHYHRFPPGCFCPSLGCGWLLVPGCVAWCSGVLVGPFPWWLGVALIFSMLRKGQPDARWFFGTCSWFVPGWQFLEGLTACCLWSSETLTLWPWALHLWPPSSCLDGHADVTKTCGLRSSVLLGAEDGCDCCPNSDSICLQDLGGHYSTFPPSLSSAFVLKTHTPRHSLSVSLFLSHSYSHY